MPELRCEAVRWVDEAAWPYFIEVQFVDAAGRRWSLIDKCVIFDPGLTPATDFPVEVTVRCEIRGEVAAAAGDAVVEISTSSPDAVQTPDGRDVFSVRRSQLVL
ncbi:hypothetical protein [Actinomadura rupiterrae]|uniref:hypothetical protein n=1 Tax=Actinomadura rupiterrae TaxID=559627 RepID=UPI0020A28ABE|nr:hypothetical protein [Actinomadura rupiterrae]MCP2342099.1 hypothetical protein [Actinomadura rupiterrae]